MSTPPQQPHPPSPDDRGGCTHSHGAGARSQGGPPPAAAEAASNHAALLSIIHSAMDAIITVNESQRVVIFNRAAARIFGVTVEDAIGSPLERFIPERARGAHAEHVREFGMTGASERSMGRLGMLYALRSDGKEFPIEASISHADFGGQKYYTVILRDITEKRKLEGQLLQAQKMESIGRLAGGVAHDFNNLLMAMFNYIQLASRKLDADHPARAHLAHVQETAERAAALTRQLLAFARKQTIHPRVLCPRETVASMEPMLRRMVGEDLKLRTVLAPDTGNVLADVSQLEQILMNLAVNARDAMPSGGTLTIETSNVELDDVYCRTRVGATPGEHVMIAVTDSGAGMTPEVLGRLFEPFFTTKPPGKGTGLGLATCHGIVNQHGGHIAVYSEVGHGTAVKVFLPRVNEKTSRKAPVAANSPARGGNETILLAEDSELIRDLASEALREAGYTVLVAEDGRKALAISQKHTGPIHLLVTDVVMPEMNGVQLAEQMAGTRPETPVIFMSGYTEETVVHHGVALGESPFIAKPFMTDALVRRVREVLDAKKNAR